MRSQLIPIGLATACAVLSIVPSLAADPLGGEDCNNNGLPDDQDIANGTAEDCNSNGVPDSCDLTMGTEEDVNQNGVPDSCERLYVDRDAPAGGDGRSWETAFRRLQDALLVQATQFVQIWVAEGTYTPTTPGGDRNLAFDIPDGTSLYGGFEGDEVNLLQRDFLAHPTILSGDLNGNDQPSGEGRFENSYHVVRNFLALEGQQINGFHIKGGQAYDESASATNKRGGAIYSASGQRWTLANCFIYDNWALEGGGAVFLRTVSLDVTNCWFFNNVAGNLNRPGRGGAILATNAALRVMNSIFSGNRAQGGMAPMGMGGAAYLEVNARVSIVNTAFHGNHATFLGGGLLVVGSQVSPGENSVRNSILWGNSDVEGEVEGSQIRLANAFTQADVTYSCVQGLTNFAHPTNTGLDPLFAQPFGPDGRPGTGDEDLHVLALSPCIDAGRNGEIPPDEADLDLDRNVSEDTPVDLDHLPRRFDDPNAPDTGDGNPPLVDMGPYERQGD